MTKHWQAVKRSKETNKTLGLEKNGRRKSCVNLKKKRKVEKNMAVSLKHIVGELRLRSKKEWPMRNKT
jgi:hypothetical protein